MDPQNAHVILQGIDKHGDEGSIVQGVDVEDQFVGVSTRSKARSVRVSIAAARLRSASVPTRPRNSRSVAPLVDGSQGVSKEKSCEYPIANPTNQKQTSELLFTAWKIMEETNRDFVAEDDQSSVDSSPSPPLRKGTSWSDEIDHTVVAPVMTHEVKTTEEQLAELKVLLENLRKDNEEKGRQIASLTRKLKKRPQREEASEEDDGADSDGAKSRSKGGTFTAQQIQEMIASTLKMQFGEVPHEGHRYVKPYSKRVDHLRMPLGYQPPKFQQFDGKGNPKQHIAHFIETCNTAGTEGDMLVKQFVRSLKGMAFDWYIDLDAESIDSWDQLETEFLNRFYSTRRIVSMVELTNTKEKEEEPVIDFINRWRALSLECKDRLSEISAVEMCIQGMNLDLVYILQGIKPGTFQELATRAHDMEITIASHGGASLSPVEANKIEDSRKLLLRRLAQPWLFHPPNKTKQMGQRSSLLHETPKSS